MGPGMAEALQLGVDVIAMAYGGNTDFCADGHVWGEPDLEHAAELDAAGGGAAAGDGGGS
ncbi:MAG: hypothetical protein ACKO45_07030 [Cyanobium sp.]